MKRFLTLPLGGLLALLVIAALAVFADAAEAATLVSISDPAIVGAPLLAFPLIMGVPRNLLFDPPADRGAEAPPATPPATPPAAPQLDQETIEAFTRTFLEQRAAQDEARNGGDGQRGNPPRPGAPALNPRAGQEEGERTGEDEQRTHAFQGRSLADLTPTQRDDLGNALYNLIQGQARKNDAQVEQAVNQLARMGHYGPEAQEAARGGARALSTLTDTNGAVFLPEVVLNEVQRLIPSYGIIRRLARSIPVPRGSVKVPNIAAGFVAFWVGEGQEIKARKPAFGSKSLDPEKMGIIIPWTTELEEETGSGFLSLVIELASEAFALLEDQSAFYGNGTSAYGGITGLANAAGVAEVSIADLTGDSGPNGQSFAHITADSLLRLKFAASSRVRMRGRFVIHPDMIEYLLGLKDTQGRYLLKMPTEDGMLPSIWGSPVEFTEAVLGPNDDAADSVFAFYGDFSRFLIGQGRALTSDLLTEATIKDVDDNTLIHLGMQDMKAIRMTQRLDMTVALAAAFSRLKTRSATT